MVRSKAALSVALLAMMTIPGAASAGPAEEANAVIDRWVAAYSANDVDALVSLYAPDALLLGTTSPILSQGTAGIRTYFQNLPGGGRRNAIAERHTIVLGEDAVLGAGFYDFARKEQNYQPRPSRFTMVIAKRGGNWLIVHHHSSPRAAARQ